MFIFWGSYDSKRKRGVVVDKCACCGTVGLLRVTQHYRIPHLYLIPLGSGKLQATELHCTECNGKLSCEEGKYSKFVPEKQARDLSVGELLQETNPRLAESLANRAKLEREAREVREVAPGAPDPRVKLAFAKLADLGLQSPQVIDLQARLAQWGAMDAQARVRLLRDVDALVAQKERLDGTVQFVRHMSQRFKPDADAFLAILTCVGVAGLGITAALLLLPASNLRGIVVVAVLVAAFVLAAIVHAKFRRHVHKRFYQQTFLPEAQGRGVAVEDAIAVLATINPRDDRLDKGIRGLAKTVPLLKEVREEAASIS